MRSRVVIGCWCVALTGCAWSPKPYTRDPVLRHGFAFDTMSAHQNSIVSWPTPPNVPIDASVGAPVSLLISEQVSNPLVAAHSDRK